MSEQVLGWIVGVSVLIAACATAILFSASEAHRREFREWATLVVNFVTLAAVIAYASVAYDQWTETRRSVDETRKLGEIGARQLEATDRPWVAARVVVTQRLKPGSDNVSLIVAFVLKNIGKSVATHIDVPFRVYPQPFSDQVFFEPLRQQEEICDKARKNNDPRSRLTLFPDEETALPASGAMSKEAALKGPIIPVLVGCVDYRYATSSVHHQTRFIYELHCYKPDAPNHPSLIDFTKPEAVPLSELRFEKYFFAGHDAD